MKSRLNTLKTLVFIAVAVAVTALAGCAGVTESARFYTLTTLPDQQSEAVTNNAMSIGVGPITVPRLLDRPQIVTRKSSNEVQLAEFHLWGGSFKEDFTRVLTDNLATQTGASVFRYPGESRQRPEYQVVVSVDRLDGVLGESVEFRGQWQILDFTKREVLHSERAVISTPLDGENYDDYVKGISQTLTKLSSQITAALKKITP